MLQSLLDIFTVAEGFAPQRRINVKPLQMNKICLEFAFYNVIIIHAGRQQVFFFSFLILLLNCYGDCVLVWGCVLPDLEIELVGEVGQLVQHRGEAGA